MTARVEVGVLHAFTQDWNITDGRRQNEMAGPFISGSAKPVKTLRVKNFAPVQIGVPRWQQL